MVLRAVPEIELDLDSADPAQPPADPVGRRAANDGTSMKALRLEVHEINTIWCTTVEVTGTWVRADALDLGRAFAKRQIDTLNMRGSVDDTIDNVARIVGEACEDVVKQAIKMERGT